MDRLEAMSIFVAIVDGGSLSAAGRQLHMPLATVSRKLGDLESHLRTRLLVRSTRTLELTDAGREYLLACRQIIELTEDAERTATGAYAHVRGQLAITAPIVFGRLHVVPLVTEFLEQHPDVDIHLRLCDRNVHLIEEHIDVALRIGALPDSSFIASPLGSVRRVLCASPHYLERFGTPTSLEALAGHRHIHFDGLGADAWTFVDANGGKRSVDVHVRLAVSTAESVIDAAERGLGIARVLSYQVADALRAGRLVRLLIDSEPPALPVSLVHPGQGRLPMKTRAFLDFAAPRLRDRLRDALQPLDPLQPLDGPSR